MTDQTEKALNELRAALTAAINGDLDVDELTIWAKAQLRFHIDRLAEGILPNTAPHEHSPIILAHAEDITAILHHYQSPSDLLYWIPRRALYVCMSGCGSIVSYAAPHDVDNASPKPVSLVRLATTEMRPGDRFVRREHAHITDVQPTSSFVVLAVLGPTEGPLHWAFDRKTLALAGLAPDSLKDTQLELLCMLGGADGDDATSDNLLEVVQRPHPYYVKWAALKALNNLGSGHVRDALARLSDDANEEIRSKARALLKQHEAELHATTA